MHIPDNEDLVHLINQQSKHLFMELNFYMVFVGGLVTLVLGFIWYSPALFGNVWMREAGLSEEQLKSGNMAKVFILTYIFSVMLSFMMMPLTIHQLGAVGMVGGDVSKALPSFNAFMADYGTAFRTFKHGALHGFMSGLFLALPITGINALFERKSWKYILINAGYWILTMTVIGGMMCAWT